MKITIDDKEIEVDLPRENVRLEEVIAEVEQFLFSVGKMPIALNFNGEDLTQEQLDAKVKEELQESDDLRFRAMDILEFILNNLNGAQQSTAELIASLNTFAEELHSSKKTVDPRAIISEFTGFFEFWMQFHKMFAKELQTQLFGGKSFSDHFSAIRTFLQEITAAMEDQDLTLGGDLVLYEIVPHLEAVQEAIPEIKERVVKIAEAGQTENQAREPKEPRGASRPEESSVDETLRNKAREQIRSRIRDEVAKRAAAKAEGQDPSSADKP